MTKYKWKKQMCKTIKSFTLYENENDIFWFNKCLNFFTYYLNRYTFTYTYIPINVNNLYNNIMK